MLPKLGGKKVSARSDCHICGEPDLRRVGVSFEPHGCCSGLLCAGSTASLHGPQPEHSRAGCRLCDGSAPIDTATDSDPIDWAALGFDK